MKINKLLLSSLILAASSSMALAASDGTITFSGDVTTNACTIAPSSIAKQVPLGSVKASSLTPSGSVGPVSDFNLELTDCTLTSGSGASATTYSKVKVAFTGNADATSATLWRNTGTAGNVAVAFKYGNSSIVPGSTIEQTLSANTNTIAMSAYMQSTGNATPGSVKAVAAYTLSYL